MSVEKSEKRKAPGLCANCIHSQRIESERGSTFILCRLSFTDPQFAKYPRLPVLLCPGYKPAT
jgi:hypothetical protein